MENCDSDCICPKCKSCIPTGKSNPKRKFFCHTLNRTIKGTEECASFVEASDPFKKRNQDILNK